MIDWTLTPDQLWQRIQWAERVVDVAEEVMIDGSTHLDADGNALIREDVFFRLIDEFTAYQALRRREI